MRVDGMLENAQLELTNGTVPTPASYGRMYMDKNVVPAIMYVYDGLAWKQVQFADSASYITNTNPGTSIVIDWSTGLKQMIILNAHCKITFSNPQSNKTHELIVQQGNFRIGGQAILYNYFLDMAQNTQQDPVNPNRPLGIGECIRYSWVYGVTSPGYATIASVAHQPAVAPLSAVRGLSLSPDGRYLSAGASSTPFHAIYTVDPRAAVPMQSPFGGRNLTGTPPTLVGNASGSCWHPGGNYYFVANATTPFIGGYPVNDGAFGTVLANPGTLPAGAANCIAISPDGTLVGVGHATTPFMSFYTFSGAAYTSKIANPGTLPAAQVLGMAFSQLGDYLAICSGTSPYLQVYPLVYSATTGITFGTVVANPATLPTAAPTGGAGGHGVAWRPQGDYVAMAMGTTPGIYVVSFNRITGVFGAVLPITTSPGVACYSCAWSPDGNYLIITGDSPGLFVYDFSAQTLGVPITFDGSAPGATVNDVVVHQSGEYLFLGMNTAVAISYSLPAKDKNYLRLNRLV